LFQIDASQIWKAVEGYNKHEVAAVIQKIFIKFATTLFTYLGAYVIVSISIRETISINQWSTQSGVLLSNYFPSFLLPSFIYLSFYITAAVIYRLWSYQIFQLNMLCIIVLYYCSVFSIMAFLVTIVTIMRHGCCFCFGRKRKSDDLRNP
jgi:hypothetical protein